jgi:hypothetical protein
VSEFKVGDKVWVQATVLELSQNSVLVRGYADKAWWMRDIDCKPVEPEAIEQKKLKAIFNVKGHDRSGTVGTITKIKGWLSLFESTDGKFLRWCHDSEFDLLDESGKRISQSSEHEAVEQPTKRELTEAQKIAERTLKAIWATQPKPEPVIKDCSTTESGSVEAKYKIGDWVEIVGPKEPTELQRRWDERMDRYIGMIVEVRALSIPTKNDDALYNLSKCGFLVFREKYLKPASEPCKEKQSEPINPSHYKQGGIEDLKKARWYLDRLIQEEEAK